MKESNGCSGQLQLHGLARHATWAERVVKWEYLGVTLRWHGGLVKTQKMFLVFLLLASSVLTAMGCAEEKPTAAPTPTLDINATVAASVAATQAAAPTLTAAATPAPTPTATPAPTPTATPAPTPTATPAPTPTHGDPDASAHGDPDASAHGDPDASAHGDPDASAHGDPDASAHLCASGPDVLVL